MRQRAAKMCLTPRRYIDNSATMGPGWVGDTYTYKEFARALFLTLRNFATFQDDVLNTATVDAYGMSLYDVPFVHIRISFMRKQTKGGVYRYIGVGFALLVQHHRAMRRPLNVERVTITKLHAFLYLYLMSLYLPMP